MLKKINVTKIPIYICLFLYSLSSSAQIAINELMASNQSSITDNFGDHEDWIELYNYSSSPVNLGGWHISDDP